ncbi:hypothetical protein I0C86_41005 [Plantactinospora sp. S1510]|uniref:N-acetyltransferase domain-containing protein n=1 Tax=Plantactinospora alkalitolerans TaxID=2789879 RepID=A0ABS0H9S5_9ACTN|nr:hypothetical protein [Plantactinospora alkalitolerans]MBF9135231.1 hypothetical protein [Plantactinospora alkalitolerans]
MSGPRQARRADIAAICHFFDMLSTSASLLGRRAPWPWPYPARRIIHAISTGAQYVLRDDNGRILAVARIAGGHSLWTDGVPAVYVSDLAALPDRGRDVAMLRYVHDRARAAGLPVRTDIPATDDARHDWWKRFGYQSVEPAGPDKIIRTRRYGTLQTAMLLQADPPEPITE